MLDGPNSTVQELLHDPWWGCMAAAFFQRDECSRTFATSSTIFSSIWLLGHEIMTRFFSWCTEDFHRSNFTLISILKECRLTAQSEAIPHKTQLLHSLTHSLTDTLNGWDILAKCSRTAAQVSTSWQCPFERNALGSGLTMLRRFCLDAPAHVRTTCDSCTRKFSLSFVLEETCATFDARQVGPKFCLTVLMRGRQQEVPPPRLQVTDKPIRAQQPPNDAPNSYQLKSVLLSWCCFTTVCQARRKLFETADKIKTPKAHDP